MPNNSRLRPIAGDRPNRDNLRVVPSRLPVLSAVFLLFALAAPLFAQVPTAETRIQIVNASGPADLRMTGPAAGDVGKPLAIMVSGLPAVDLSATVGDQTKWIDALRFDVSGPSGAVELDKELSMSVSPWEWRLRITLTPATAGVYVVVCDWNQEPYGLALHRVTIGGTAPADPTDPPSDPNAPPQPPDPSRKCLRVTYVYEKDQSSPPRPVQAALQAINASGGVVASDFEDDTVDGSGETPDQYVTALAEATKAGLPALVVEFSDGTVRVVNDPKTAEAVTEAVKP